MIILNEKEYVEEFLKTNEITDKPIFMANLLARYYYHCKGMRDEELTGAMIQFLDSRYPDSKYFRDRWIDKLEDIIGKAHNYPLHEIDGVWITSSELEKIASISNKVLERLAFTLLCLAKFNLKRNPKSNGWVNNSYKEIFKLARITVSTDKRCELLGVLYRNGFFEMSDRLDILSLRITYIDDESQDTLFISDFRELGYEYLKYKGENFIRCEECGLLVRGNKRGTKKYCPNCVYTPPMEVKAKYCADCGDLFEINSKNNQSKRCPYCQMLHRRDCVRANVQKLRGNKI